MEVYSAPIQYPEDQALSLDHLSNLTEKNVLERFILMSEEDKLTVMGFPLTMDVTDPINHSILMIGDEERLMRDGIFPMGTLQDKVAHLLHNRYLRLIRLVAVNDVDLLPMSDVNEGDVFSNDGVFYIPVIQYVEDGQRKNALPSRVEEMLGGVQIVYDGYVFHPFSLWVNLLSQKMRGFPDRFEHVV